MDNNAETIAEIVAELAQYEESGERPCKEEVWRLGARIAAAARVAVLAEQERCATIADGFSNDTPRVAMRIADAIRGERNPVTLRPPQREG